VTRISLVRHGQTDWNLSKRIQGTSDIPLNDMGRAQAMATGEILNRRQWDAIYSSPLSRAHETAQIIAVETGLAAPVTIAAIAERNYGEAEGLTGQQILARFPEGTVVPGRESRDEVVRRALPALLELAETHRGKSLIVVSHGAVISSLVRHLSKGTLPAPGELIANGSVHDFVVRNGALELKKFNSGSDDRDLFTAAVT
jgi:uncharacterized phosphatase